MLNDHKTVDVEFLGNLSYNCKISFSDGSQLVVVNFQWLTTVLLIFNDIVSLQNFLSHPCSVSFLVVPEPTIVDVESCLPCFMTHFDLEKVNFSSLLFV